ncbi:MAG: TAT-variant-translocated molybdopterin oxidoreductase [Alphaproteobacteria bacterium]
MTGSGRDYWRRLKDLANSPEFAAIVEREAPRFLGALDGLDRRRFLQIMAAPMVLSVLSGCGPESDSRQLVPYVEQPPDLVPSVPRYYATAFTDSGYAEGVLLRHVTGRPVKVEGNPNHPASLGAASAPMQASILSLYDPRRAQTIVGGGQVQSWPGFVAALYARREALRATGGSGLRLLTGAITSPTLIEQAADLQRQFPEMRWVSWEPLDRGGEREADTRLLGRAFDRVYDLAQAEVVFGVESDLISSVPGWLAHARQFAAMRRPYDTAGRMSRVYAIESSPTLLGAKADHRLPLRPAEIAAALRHIAGAVGAGPREWTQTETGRAPWLAAAAEDLVAHRGHVLVHAGREQPAEVHRLAGAINTALGAFGSTIGLIEPVTASPASAQSLAELVADMQAGAVDTLVMIDTNPVYAAPADLDFAAALKRVPFSVSLSLYPDETALASTWIVPKAHEYEAWGDARAFNGVATIQQPQVLPLYGGRSAHEVLGVLRGDTAPKPRELVRETWRQWTEKEGRGDFETFWHETLRAGIVADSVSPPLPNPPLRNVSATPGRAPETVAAGLTLLFRPDEMVGDGRFTDNAWLLELGRPFTRLTWDNAALIAPRTAARLGVESGDVVLIGSRHGQVTAPVFVLPGQAEDCVTLTLGFGRRAGGLAAGIGYDAYRLRGAAEPWATLATSFVKTGERYPLAEAQGQDDVTGHKDLIREGTLTQYVESPDGFAQESEKKSLYPRFDYPRHAWGMTIDLNSCIGCQACVTACQAENNIPTVGKEQVLKHRIMHWLRIDRYYDGPPENPSVAFEPMPCMHCEKAPCEVVCPVHATVHDHSGLNLMVYNRCVGTRFCSNNCPYKVRRFNFFGYAFEESDQGRPPQSWNPEVTVRGRGVMEKCTYCIQRIRHNTIQSEIEQRPLADGDIITACQQSCPTQAIVFGDINNPESAVARRKATPLNYVLLEELNTWPRTSYLALVRNPNPAIPTEAA